MGISQHTHGTDNPLPHRPGLDHGPGRTARARACIRCAVKTTSGASDAGLIPMVFPDYQSVEVPDIRTKFEDFWKFRP